MPQRFQSGATEAAIEAPGATTKALLEAIPELEPTLSQAEVVATLPLDYVCWTERVAQFARREDLASRRPEVLIPGRFSSRAKSEMEQAGWEIREGVPLGVIFEP